MFMNTRMNAYPPKENLCMRKTVLILGSHGKIGSHSAQAFESAGWEVRRFRRGVDSLKAAATGVDVIVNGFNPPGYRNWATSIPRYTTEIIEAAKASGATIIVPGNVYVFGDCGGTWDANTPHRATTRKGRIRIDMETAYRQAADEGVQTIVLRAGDFLDPNRDGTLMGQAILREIAKGRIASLGDPSARHAYAYVPDWARAAVMLAEMRNTLSTFEDIPFPGTTFTMEELASVIAEASQRKIEIVRFGWWMMYLASPFWRLAFELLEMRYLYGLDHELSSQRFDALLPEFQATPRREVMLCEIPPELLAQEHPLSANRATDVATADARGSLIP